MGFKLLNFRAKGYKGFHARLDSSEVYIDFTKFTHKIIMIKGPNGWGKSTLINILHQLPDPLSWIMDTEVGGKQLTYLDTLTGATLFIDIRYPLVNGKRGTTKAYISRTINNEVVQLNDNGNVSSFKEIIESIFGIDPNFLALSKLTFEDRGLVDKSVAERKRFMNAIIEDVEVFNNMHKVLSKKSTIFKANVNRMIAKLNDIGDVSEIDATICSLEQRIENFGIQKDKLIEEIGKNKSKIQLLDPNGSIQSKYDEIYNSLKSINEELQIIENSIKKINNINADEESISNIFDSLKKEKIKLEGQIRIEQTEIDSLLKNIENESDNLQVKNAKLQSLQIENKYDDLKNRLSVSQSNIDSYKVILDNINLPDIFNISKDEFILAINALYDIKDTISIFRSNVSGDKISIAINLIRNKQYPRDINDIIREIDTNKEELSNLKIEQQRYITLSNVASKLQERPSNCTINTCNFIKDALEAANSQPEEKLINISARIEQLENNLIQLEKAKEDSTEVNLVFSNLNSIIRSIETNRNIINKLPAEVSIFTNREAILNAIEDGYQFNEIDRLYDLLQYANIIELYKIEVSNVKSIQVDLKVYEAKNELIDDILNDINKLNNNIQQMQDDINTRNNNINNYNNLLSDINIKLDIVDKLLSLFRNKKEMLANKQMIINNYENIKNSMNEIKMCIANINNLEASHSALIDQMKPLMDDRDTLKHSRKLSEEYSADLQTYQAQYNMVEVLKKYSSPTQKGIQILFIKIYMNDIIELANNILSLLFNGEYIIQQFIIDENQFSIPCIGNRIPCDDVSSMSGSQKCMIGLSLSCALLTKAGPNYNILRLDEIDSTLDNYNRSQFINTLYAIIQIMNIEQVIVISHNEEMDTADTDIIYIDEIGVA